MENVYKAKNKFNSQPKCPHQSINKRILDQEEKEIYPLRESYF